MYNELCEKKISIKSIFKIAAKIYVDRFLYILFMGLLINLPMQLLIDYMPKKFLLTNEELSLLLDSGISGYMDLFGTEQFIVIAEKLTGYTYYIMGMYIIFTSILTGFITHISRQHILNKSVTLDEISEHTFLKWGKYIVTSLLYMIFIVFSAPTIILPFYIITVFVFHGNIVACTNYWGLKALFESARIVSRKFFRILFFFIFLNITKFVFENAYSIIIFSVISSNNYFVIFLIRLVLNILVLFFDIVIAVKFLNLWEMYERSKLER